MILYHGTTDYAAVDILSSEEVTFSKGDKHYLGEGIYLYADPYHALTWATLKAKSKKLNPFVFQFDVEVVEDEFMDLDLRKDQDFFFQRRREYIRAIEVKELNRDYYNDSQFCDFISEYFGVKMLAKTFVYVHSKDSDLPVRYSNQKDTDYNITRHFRTEKQFCLKENKWIKSIKEWKVG